MLLLMKFTSKYIADMISCAESKLAAASSVAWRREYYGLYSLTDALCHINQLILYIFLLKRWNNSPSAINASTEEGLSNMFDRIIRMPYPCVLAPEVTSEVTVNHPPIVDAGPDQNLNSLTTSTILTGTVTDPDGNSFTVQWTKISGGNVTINTPLSIISSITNMQPGVYVFQLTATDSKGASASDTVTITIANSLGIIYWGRNDTGLPETDLPTFVKSQFQFQANGALDVYMPWLTGATHPEFCWVAIPNTAPASNKNRWFVDIINQGNIGTPTDLLGAPQSVMVDDIEYLLWCTNYKTQFSQICTLKKV
jgi:hypothetical protein